MVYCKKCARLLDEDVRACPYCGETDDRDEKNNGFDAMTENGASTGGEKFEDSLETGQDSSNVLDKLRRLDEQIARNETAETIIPPPVANQSSQLDAARMASASDSYRRQTAGAPVPPPEPKPGGGLYVGMIFLSIFIGLAGFIVGIVYMMNKSAAYRKMGLVMLLVSIASMLCWVVACCGLGYLLSESVSITEWATQL